MSLQLVANVFVLAAIYALVSTGYVLIYRVSRVLNLAHGELMMVGAYFLVATSGLFSGNPILALALAALCGLAMGAAVYAVLMRWMTGEAVLAAVLITIALGILLRGLAVLIWTTQQFYPGATLGWHNPSVRVAPGVQISAASIAIVVVTVLVYLGLFGFLQFTRWGVRMRAAGQNPLLAEQRGIRLHGIYAFAWGLSTFTASLAGMLLALDSGVESTMATIGLKAFPAALVGGLDSLLGAAIGALIVADGGDRRHPVRQSAAVRRGAVRRAADRAGDPAMGPVRQPRTTRSGLRWTRADRYAQDLALFGTRRARRAACRGGVRPSVVLPFVASPFLLDLANQVLLACIGALALMLLTGFAGLISLGTAGLSAAGAYTVGVLFRQFGAPFWVTLPAAALLGALARA